MAPGSDERGEQELRMERAQKNKKGEEKRQTTK